MAIPKKLLHVAQKLDVIEENPETMEKRIYFSRVEDVREDSVLIIPPFQQGFTLPPRIGRVISAKVISERVPYLFEATLLQYVSGQFPLWEISKPEEARKIQMRDNVRLSIILDTKLERLDSAGVSTGKIISTLTKDLSAGGIQVVLPEHVPMGTRLKVTLPLTPGLVIETVGDVVRVLPPVTDADKLAAGIKFVNLDEKIQNQVIKYIFAKEAEKRQKDREWNM